MQLLGTHRDDGRMLTRLLPFMVQGEASLDVLAQKSSVGRSVLEGVIQGLADRGIVVFNGGTVVFDTESRLRAAIVALEAGAGREEVARGLSWLDFEKLAARMLVENGFSVLRSVRVGKRRLQIDVLGYSSRLGVAIDCKQWRNIGGVSVFTKVVEKQVNRCRELVREDIAERLGLENLVPVVVTLYADAVKVVRRVPIVPISGFDSFIREVPGRLNEMRVIKCVPFKQKNDRHPRTPQ